jgi:hypothetical protein
VTRKGVRREAHIITIHENPAAPKVVNGTARQAEGCQGEGQIGDAEDWKGDYGPHELSPSLRTALVAVTRETSHKEVACPSSEPEGETEFLCHHLGHRRVEIIRGSGIVPRDELITRPEGRGDVKVRQLQQTRRRRIMRELERGETCHRGKEAVLQIVQSALNGSRGSGNMPHLKGLQNRAMNDVQTGIRLDKIEPGLIGQKRVQRGGSHKNRLNRDGVV